MKYWRGYIVAALCVALTIALMAFSESHGALVDMIYPYAARLIQTSLAEWTAGVDFCLWQLLAVVLAVVALASIVVMIALRWNFFQWLGWVLAACSCLYMLHTGIYGLNSYASDLSEDIRLEQADFTVTELAEATTYYMQMADGLSNQVPRNPDGTPNYPSFADMALMASEGFRDLTHRQYYAVFSGSTLPVKELGWADLYTSMGITGVTMPLTGEAAVNPQTPVVALPFVMCHEMCHRSCIALERDANLGAYLACIAHSDPIYQYSGYFMAFRYCYNALASVGTTAATAAANQIYSQMGQTMRQDLKFYTDFFNQNRNEAASNLADSANDAYIKASGDEAGVASYAQVSDLLVSWYIQGIYLPAHKDEQEEFDPMDRNDVDLSENPVMPTEGH